MSPHADPEVRKQYMKTYMKAYGETHREERRAYMKAYGETHREEKRAYDKVYGKTYYEVHREERRASVIMRKYRVSRQSAELLVSLRDGEGAWCDICRTTNGPFMIDHDHETGRIRGILCRSCNTALHRRFPIQAAADYLRAEAIGGRAG
jgi:hypothetical protein